MWPKRAIDWIENGTALVSVPFTWELPQAYSRCAFLREQGYKVRAGGPAVNLMPDYLVDVAEIGGEVDALKHHNPDATFTSRGCIRKCGFCAVPKIEGDLVEPLGGVDFNQGLDARLLTDYHAARLAGLALVAVRLAWDHVGLESTVMTAIERLERVGFLKRQIRVYVLIGYDDTPEDALYRFETLKAWGIWPNPQRYNPLDALKRDSYVAPNWTHRELKRMMRYWGRQAWLGGISYEEYIG